MSEEKPNAQWIRAAEAGGPEVLELAEGYAPPPGPDQVRVKQTAIGVNYIDLYARRSYIQLFGRDRVPGFEAAGVADAVGENVSHVSEGDRVAYVTMRAGAYATLRTVPADRVVKVPDSVGDEEAGAALIKGTTASYLLRDIALPAAGDQVVVIWAAGGVGGMLCQWAASLGARVIGVVAREAQEQYASSCGAAEVIVSGPEGLGAKVKELTGRQGAGFVFDAVGGPVFDEAVAMLGLRGRFVSYGSAGGQVGERDIGVLAAKSIIYSKPDYFHYLGGAAFRPHAEEVFAKMEQGVLKVHVAERFAFAEARAAHEYKEGRGVCGSVVLVV